MARDFARISVSQPNLNIYVAAPIPGELLVYPDFEAREAFDRGEFGVLDRLNAELGIESIERVRWHHPDLASLHIKFTAPYHHEYLIAQYSEVSGVRFASYSGPAFFGGPSGLFKADPRPDEPGEARTYNFQYGSGDCPAGCLNRWNVTVFVTDTGIVRVDPNPSLYEGVFRIEAVFGDGGPVEFDMTDAEPLRAAPELFR